MIKINHKNVSYMSHSFPLIFQAFRSNFTGVRWDFPMAMA